MQTPAPARCCVPSVGPRPRLALMVVAVRQRPMRGPPQPAFRRSVEAPHGGTCAASTRRTCTAAYPLGGAKALPPSHYPRPQTLAPGTAGTTAPAASRPVLAPGDATASKRRMTLAPQSRLETSTSPHRTAPAVEAPGQPNAASRADALGTEQASRGSWTPTGGGEMGSIGG